MIDLQNYEQIVIIVKVQTQYFHIGFQMKKSKLLLEVITNIYRYVENVIWLLKNNIHKTIF